MRQAIIYFCLLFLFQLDVNAQWSSNLWPAASNWFVSGQSVYELNQALSERYEIINGVEWTNKMTNAPLWVSRTHLMDIEDECFLMFNSFIDPDKADAGGIFFDDHFSTNTSMPVYNSTRRDEIIGGATGITNGETGADGWWVSRKTLDALKAMIDAMKWTGEEDSYVVETNYNTVINGRTIFSSNVCTFTHENVSQTWADEFPSYLATYTNGHDSVHTNLFTGIFNAKYRVSMTFALCPGGSNDLIEINDGQPALTDNIYGITYQSVISQSGQTNYSPGYIVYNMVETANVFTVSSDTCVTDAHGAITNVWPEGDGVFNRFTNSSLVATVDVGSVTNMLISTLPIETLEPIEPKINAGPNGANCTYAVKAGSTYVANFTSAGRLSKSIVKWDEGPTPFLYIE